MKKLFQVVALTAIGLVATLSASGQTNSVELKNGGGSLISSHNSISAAIAAIPGTISQAYVIEITGTYTGANETYPVTFEDITGASATNTITLRPATGVTNAEIDRGSTGIAVELDDADYIIIDGRPGGTGTAGELTISQKSTGTSTTLQFINGATHNVVRYCKIFNGSTTSAGRGIYFNNSTSNPSGNSDNLIEHCEVEGGRYGINSDAGSNNFNERNKIYGTSVYNNYFAGFWIESGTGSIEIDSCRIYHEPNFKSTTGPFGILFDGQTDTAKVTRNKIYDLDITGTSDIVGISVRSVSGTNLTYIVNNFISLTKSNRSDDVFGIDYGGSGATNGQVYFNTIKIGGTLTSGGSSGDAVSAAFYKDASSSSASFDIKNNIFINDRSGGNTGVQHPAMAVTNTNGTITQDYNVFNSSTTDLTRWGTTATTTIADHILAVPTGNSLNSNSTTVNLVSNTDLHVTGASLGDFDLKATPILAVTNDIDNNPRGSVTYRGADDDLANPIVGKKNEIGVVSIDEPFTGSCGATQSVKATVRNFGVNQVDTFTVNWSINGTLQTPIVSYAVLDTALGNGSITAQVTLGTFTATAGTTYDIKVWTSLPNNLVDTDNSNDSTQDDFKQGLAAGTYTIGGATPDFATLNDAVTELNNFGICGAVVFDIRTGTYNERFTLNEIAGASATNTITFRSETGIKTDVVISEAAASSTANNFVILLDGADHIIIENLTIERSGTGTSSRVISLDGDIENVSIHDNIIRGPSNTSTNTNGSRSNIYAGSNTKTKDLVIYNNQLENNSIGVWLDIGTSNKSTGTKIYSNTITPNYGGIYVENQYYPEIYKNKVTRIDQTINVDFFGISLNIVDSAYLVSQNEVASNRGYGIRLRTCAGYAGKEGLVINNLVTMNYEGSSNVYGITSETRGSYQLFAHNTSLLNVNYTSSSSTRNGARAFYMPTNTSNRFSDIRVLNNIFYSTIDGVAAWFVNNAIGGVTELDYNLYYATAPEITYISAYMASFADHKTTSGKDDNSYNQTLTFAGKANARLSFMQRFAFGRNDLNITEDVNGDPRCVPLPTVGADEYNAGTSLPVSLFKGPSNPVTNDRAYFLFDGNINQIAVYKWYVNNTLESEGLNLTYTFPATGSYDVKLVVENCNGKDSTSISYTINDPTVAPVADFSVDKNQIFVNESVQLRDLSSNGATSWAWTVTPNNFGQVIFSDATEKDPTVLITEPGEYEVCLTATNAIGSSAQLCRTAYVKVSPQISMCNETTSTFGSGKLFDDGGPLSNYGANKNCTFFINPCASEVTLKFNEWTPTDADDKLSIYDGDKADPSKLIATITGGMTNPGGTTGFTSKSGRMWLVWETDGFTQNAGFEAEWSSVPTSVNATIAGFSIPDTLFVNSPATFTNTSSGDGLTFIWDFDSPNVVGDNDNEFDKENPTKTYTSTGTYQVELESTNCLGTDVASKSVVVVAPTVAPTPVDFTASLVKANVNEVVRLTDISGNGPTSWNWEITPSNGVIFLDPATSPNPRVSFSFGGNYTVKLIVSNAIGSDSTEKTSYIEVLAYCQPNIAIVNTDITIRRVVFEGIDQSSSFGVSKYNDFTNNSQVGQAAKGRTYPISIERNTNNETVNFAVWIDFNQDGDFTDSNERVLFDSASTAQILSGSISIPSKALLGETRMRVAVSKGDLTTPACGPVVVGEYEDYKVNIKGDDLAPVITIIGAATQTVEQGFSYNDSGATAFDNVDGNISSKIVVTGSVDSSAIGNYTITYTVTDSAGNTTTAQRRVIVTPDVTKPVLTRLGADTVRIDVFTSYTDAGATAIDNPVGVSLTNNIIVTGSVDTAKIGTYVLNYTVTDAAGNTASVQRVIIVSDNTKPVIALNGNTTITHDVNTPYIDGGAVVTDNYDNSIVYTVTGTVDINVLGSYTLVYKATDASGNVADSVVRAVNVVDRIGPTITLVGNDIVNLARWQNYTDEGYTLSDNFYDSTQITVDVLGTWVNSLAEGSFFIQYRATDPSGNITLSAKRFIDVRGTNSITGVDAQIANIYPNPSNGSFVIESSKAFNANTHITVTNTLGARVFEAKPTLGSNKVSVNLQGTSAGIYFVNISNGDKTETTKIVIR